MRTMNAATSRHVAGLVADTGECIGSVTALLLCETTSLPRIPYISLRTSPRHLGAANPAAFHTFLLATTQATSFQGTSRHRHRHSFDDDSMPMEDGVSASCICIVKIGGHRVTLTLGRSNSPQSIHPYGGKAGLTMDNELTSRDRMVFRAH